MTGRRAGDRRIARVTIGFLIWITACAARSDATVPGPTAADSASAPVDSSAALPGTAAISPVADSVAALRPDSALAAFAPPAPRAPTIHVPRVVIEIGPRTDVTNELYVDYGDAFIDSTAIGGNPRWAGTPEVRASGVLSVTLTAAREHSFQYWSATGVELGNLVERVGSTNRFTWGAWSPWSFALDPAGEYRHDRTFGLDRKEARASLGARVMRTSLDGLTRAELAVWGDLLRSSGEGSEFLLDRDALGAGLAFTRQELANGTLLAGVRSTARMFPDSIERDHREHSGELDWRAWSFSGGTMGLGVLVVRRIPQRMVSASRDDFWNLEAAADAELPIAGSFRIRWNGGAELQRYARPDSIAEFDYTLGRAAAALVWSPAPRWRLALGPRIERFVARQSPEESYWETAAAGDFEWVGAGSWWTLAPAAGWREMDDAPPGTFGSSSYAFVSLDLFVDQPLASRWVVRAGSSVRIENHVDASQDARSLQASLELRWRVQR